MLFWDKLIKSNHLITSTSNPLLQFKNITTWAQNIIQEANRF